MDREKVNVGIRSIHIRVRSFDVLSPRELIFLSEEVWARAEDIQIQTVLEKLLSRLDDAAREITILREERKRLYELIAYIVD